MKVDLNGKIAVVTGAGGAIGRSIALRFAENGACVAVCDIQDKNGLETVSLVTQSGGKAKYYRHDVSNMADTKSNMAQIAADFGKIDILVNNAGVNVSPDKRASIDEFDDEIWKWLINVDLDGVYHCSKSAIPFIPQGGGSILNISSVVGCVPFRNQCAFAAAKAGVVNLTKAMALELGGRDIRVNVIAPGSIAMEGTKALIYDDDEKTKAMLSQVPLKRPGTPEDIAYAALYISSPEAGYVTGSLLVVDGGWTCGYARNF